MVMIFSVLKLFITGHVIRVLPFKKAYQIKKFSPLSSFLYLYPIQSGGDISEEWNKAIQMEVPEQVYKLEEESQKETKLITECVLTILQDEERKRVPYNSSSKLDTSLEVMNIERLSVTDLMEVSLLIPNIFQSSPHNWGPALGLPDSGFPEYMKSYLSEPLLIEELGCFGIRNKISSKFIGAIILENMSSADKHKEEKESKDFKELEGSEIDSNTSTLENKVYLENPGEVKEDKEEMDKKEVDPVLNQAYLAITGLLEECEEFFRLEYLQRCNKGDIGYKMDSKFAYVGNETIIDNGGAFFYILISVYFSFLFSSAINLYLIFCFLSAYIAIDDSCRGKGMAGKLIDTSLKRMVENNYEFAVAYCVSPNARHVFQKQGFELWGQIPYSSYILNGRHPYSTLPDEVSVLVKKISS